MQWRDDGNLRFTAPSGEVISINEWQKRTSTDSLLVLRDGRIEFESYATGMSQKTPHALWSMSKSMVGLVAMMAIDDGRLDPTRQIVDYLPELKGTGWEGATVQQALDMQVGVAYRETFADPSADIFRYLFAAALLPPPPGVQVSRNLYDYLGTIKPGGRNGESFDYKSVDTEVLGWILKRVYGRNLSELLSERVWSRIGATEEAFYLVDPAGSDIASIGFNATPIDLGRLGLALAASANGSGRLLRKCSLDALRDGSTRPAFALSSQASIRKGYSYHNQWWLPNDGDGTIEAKGLFGQHLIVNPKKGVVIVKLSANPAGDTISTHAIDKAAFAAIIANGGGQHR